MPPTDLNTKKQKVNNNEAKDIENPESINNDTEPKVDSDAIQTDLNMDTILDKISKSGIDSLSKEERKFKSRKAL